MTTTLTREDVEELKIRDGIGWKRDPDEVGWLISAGIVDYVAEIERLRAALASQSHQDATTEIDRLRSALEDARRDFNHMIPKSDTGSVRKQHVENSVHRIEMALSVKFHKTSQSLSREAEIRREVIEECAKQIEARRAGISAGVLKVIADDIRALAQQPDKEPG